METAPKRRRQKGSAWHWKQTDCWYYTPVGTSKRVPLIDESGKRIRGSDSRKIAELALARVKLAKQWKPVAESVQESTWPVAKVCSHYIQDCERRASHGSLSREYCSDLKRSLNDLCGYCGAMSAAELKKGHVYHWIESHETWRSPVTRRNVIAMVLAAFNSARDMHGVQHALKGLKKPPSRPRLHSLSSEDEQLLYKATDKSFRDFLFAAVHTGLRPYCELARLTSQDVIETSRGMMWRIYSSKTKKTRTIPVRPDVARLTKRLMDRAADSSVPVFRNPQGRAWKKVTGVARFLQLKRQLGWDLDPVKKHYSSYTCRHTFAHRMLSGYWNGGAGCTIEVLAELLGDTPKVAFDHYGKEWGQHYQDPLWKAVGLV